MIAPVLGFLRCRMPDRWVFRATSSGSFERSATRMPEIEDTMLIPGPGYNDVNRVPFMYRGT